MWMTLWTMIVGFELVKSGTYKKGGVVVLSPGSVFSPITSITWKHGLDIAAEWYGGEETMYRNFKGRCELNINTGALRISNLSLEDSGNYTAVMNNRIMKTTEITVIAAVPKPTISTHCNPEETQCTLTCEASITKDTGPVTYTWKIGDRQRPPSSNQLNITKDDPESVGKWISCQLENPVSRERSDDIIMSAFTNTGSSRAGTIAAVIVPIVLMVIAGFVFCHKRKPHNAHKTWSQYFTHFFAPKKCINCGWEKHVAQDPEADDPEEDSEDKETTDLKKESAGNQKTAMKHLAAPTSEVHEELKLDQTPPGSADTSSESAVKQEQKEQEEAT